MLTSFGDELGGRDGLIPQSEAEHLGLVALDEVEAVLEASVGGHDVLSLNVWFRARAKIAGKWEAAHI